jgi:hypothetical protein
MVPFIADSDFDPGNVDLQYIKSVSESMPADGRIDINQSEILAAKTLRAADYCIDLVAQASQWCELKESEKNEAKALAVARLIEKGVSATAAAQQYDADPDYVRKCRDYAKAKGWYKWIDLKYKNFMAAHVHYKDVMKRNIKHEQSSGFKSDGCADEFPTRNADTTYNHPHKEDEKDKKTVGAEDW